MVAEVIVSGVPQMLPLVVPNERPEGKVVLMVKETASILGTQLMILLSMVILNIVLLKDTHQLLRLIKLIGDFTQKV